MVDSDAVFRKMSRRAFLTAVPAIGVAGSRLFGATTPRPFRIDIPQSTISRILKRVKEARWPDRLDSTDWRYGANWDYMKGLAEYWTTKYDWRKAEARLNRYPQFVANVGSFDVHFYHVRGKGSRPIPLVLTHGWPGSVLEFQEETARLVQKLAKRGIDSWLMTRGYIRPSILRMLAAHKERVRVTVGLTTLNRGLQRII